jgi:hypothetical protein
VFVAAGTSGVHTSPSVDSMNLPLMKKLGEVKHAIAVNVEASFPVVLSEYSNEVLRDALSQTVHQAIALAATRKTAKEQTVCVVCKTGGLKYKLSRGNPSTGEGAKPASSFSCRILEKRLYCKGVSERYYSLDSSAVFFIYIGILRCMKIAIQLCARSQCQWFLCICHFLVL